jgi:hypothetical protein
MDNWKKGIALEKKGKIAKVGLLLVVSQMVSGIVTLSLAMDKEMVIIE